MSGHPFSICIYRKSNYLPVKIEEIKDKTYAFKSDSISLLTLKNDFYKRFDFIDNPSGNHYLKHGDIVYIEELNRFYVFGFEKNHNNEIKAFGFFSLVDLPSYEKYYQKFITYSLFETMFLKNHTFKYICNVFIQKKAVLESIFRNIQNKIDYKLLLTDKTIKDWVSFKDSIVTGEIGHVQLLLKDKIIKLNLNYKNIDIINNIDILKHLNEDNTNFEIKINPRIHGTVKGGNSDSSNIILYTNSIIFLNKFHLSEYMNENSKNKNKENIELLERTRLVLFYLDSSGFCILDYLDGKEYSDHLLYDSIYRYDILNKLENKKLYNETIIEKL